MCRPGEGGRACSATLGFVADRILYAFTTNAPPFESHHPYNAVGIYARLEHDGDFSAAAKALYAMGYSKRLRSPTTATYRPLPDNRNQRADKIESCKPYFFKRIELIGPRVICTLGNFSTHLLLGKKVRISQVRGQAFTHGAYVVIPMVHPAAALHREGMIEVIKKDFPNLRTILDQGVEPPSSAATTDQGSFS